MTEKEESRIFIAGIESDNAEAVCASAKSDLHCHGAAACRLNRLEEYLGYSIEPAPQRMIDLGEMELYMRQKLRPVFSDIDCLMYVIKEAFKQADSDGVTVLQMSIDCRHIKLFEGNAEQLICLIKRIHEETSPQIFFIPQLGIDRSQEPQLSFQLADACIQTGFFKSIDLYGKELSRDVSAFIPLYRKASEHGLRLGAHAGEFGDAESVRRTVELLELEFVQHGIAVASSAEIMTWLRNANICLNICPSSNVALSRVESLQKHPIKKMFDAGLNVTINTDDLIIFGQSISDEFFNLYKAGVFTAGELDIIRLNGLKQKERYTN